MEHAFGQDFGGVDAHLGQADALGTISAHGAARGESIAFASSQPDVATVAHELTHVVQSRGGTTAGVQGRGGVSDPGSDAEVEAEDVAQTVAAGGRAEVTSVGLPDKVHRWANFEFRGDAPSHDDKPTAATREEDYRPTGDLAAKVGDNHWRVWGFEVGSDELPGDYVSVIVEIGNAINDDLSASVAVHGHTSASGSEAGNIGLSMRRAQAVIALLKAFKADSSRCVPYQHGEATPLVDEADGPAAMARNRRVEIFVSPGAAPPPRDSATLVAPNPPASDDVKESFVGCRDLEMYIRLNKAELIAWTTLESQGRRGGTGARTVAFGEDYMQPDRVDWEMAYRAEGVPPKIGNNWYENLKQPLDANLLRYKNELSRQIEKYEQMINDEQCNDGIRLDPVLSDPDYYVKEYQGGGNGGPNMEGPKPGDTDPKGRKY